jgi:hypothetical protein
MKIFNTYHPPGADWLRAASVAANVEPTLLAELSPHGPGNNRSDDRVISKVLHDGRTAIAICLHVHIVLKYRGCLLQLAIEEPLFPGQVELAKNTLELGRGKELMQYDDSISQ